MKLQFTEIKHIRNEVENTGVSDWKDVVASIAEDMGDFEVDGYRFIHEDVIDEIMQEELKNDTYILGCFNANFLAEHIELSEEIIVALQEGEKYEALGEHCLAYIEEIQEAYRDADGFGHHFAHYDHHEYELDIDQFDEQGVKTGIETYHYFRVN